MVGAFKYVKFFRFRSPYIVADTKVGFYEWLFYSLRYIDFNYDSLLNESIRIMNNLYGGFTWTDLKNLEFDKYKKLIKEIIKFQKEQEQDGRS